MEGKKNYQPNNEYQQYSLDYFVRLGFTPDEAQVFVPRWRSDTEQIAAEMNMGLIRRDSFDGNK